MAVSQVSRQETDVVVLDIEMPIMDGLTALPKILAAAPDVKVIMASTLTQKNAQISLKALSAGAADYVAKPSSSELHAATNFQRELVEKVKLSGVPAAHGGVPPKVRRAPPHCRFDRWRMLASPGPGPSSCGRRRRSPRP